MILSLSNAQGLFWLGRYMVRNTYILSSLPFEDHDRARRFARAFSVSAWDAQSLTDHLEHIQSCVQQARGLIPAHAFECFNAMWRQRFDDNVNMLGLLKAAEASMVACLPEVKLFWLLGVQLETVETALRLANNPMQAIDQLIQVAMQLPMPYWQPVVDQCELLKQRPSFVAYYDLCDQLNDIFKDGP
jgi:hypothetical protein